MSNARRIKTGYRIALMTWVICLGIILAAVWLHIVYHPYYVEGPSMLPTFQEGDIVSTKEPEKIRTGDVVILRADEPQRTMIKRIQGIPGDTVVIKNGTLYRNGEATNVSGIREAGILKQPVTLEDQEYIAIGDNVNNSNDSRFYGTVNRDHIDRLVEKKILPVKKEETR